MRDDENTDEKRSVPKVEDVDFDELWRQAFRALTSEPHPIVTHRTERWEARLSGKKLLSPKQIAKRDARQKRQEEVIAELASGKTRAQVARDRGLSITMIWQIAAGKR